MVQHDREQYPQRGSSRDRSSPGAPRRLLAEDLDDVAVVGVDVDLEFL